ncbi:MAG: hypothetical protein JNM69_39665, partial [Archangium sp.]|nr:hypothetical protein [Archangium sp.]
VGAFFNDAGDGRFDQTYTSTVEVVVGRVDFEGLPVFGADAGTGLLGRYLDKVHRFRTGAAPLPRRALVRPGFGYFSGEAFGRAAYRDGTAILGVEPVDAPFFPTLEQDGGVLLAWGDGAGGPTSASGVTNSSELAMRVPQTRLMALFGSYFGDWSYSNALMRTALGSGEVVASFWYARPSVQVYGLGALESFGQSYARDTSFAYRSMPVYQALLGDPTLRLFYPTPVASLAAQPGVNGVQLSWPPYTNRDFIGYHVYRRSLAGGIAGRLTATPVSTESFLDTTALPSTTYEWRVVAVVRETTGSGTFWNHSLGARSVAMTLAVPDAGVPPVDAGVMVDAGAQVDAGSVLDAGAVVDAGVRVDGGAVLDAGVMADAGAALDAGSDAGAVAEDGGLLADAGVLEDAGLVVDAGAEDAGAADAGVAADAGLASDAGVTTDGGYTPLPLDPMPTDPGAAVGGCGCSGASSALPMLMLIALIRRRRR